MPSWATWSAVADGRRGVRPWARCNGSSAGAVGRDADLCPAAPVHDGGAGVVHPGTRPLRRGAGAPCRQDSRRSKSPKASGAVTWINGSCLVCDYVYDPRWVTPRKTSLREHPRRSARRLVVPRLRGRSRGVRKSWRSNARARRSPSIATNTVPAAPSGPPGPFLQRNIVPRNSRMCHPRTDEDGRMDGRMLYY